jgi:hypothetical protein
MHSNKVCRFKDICTSDYCDLCECEQCTTLCKWEDKCTNVQSDGRDYQRDCERTGY